MKPPATLKDLDGLPAYAKGEIIEGVLHSHPRGRGDHQKLVEIIAKALQAAYGSSSSWTILIEPKIGMGNSLQFSPDLAGWRTERLTAKPPARPATAAAAAAAISPALPPGRPAPATSTLKAPASPAAPRAAAPAAAPAASSGLRTKLGAPMKATAPAAAPAKAPPPVAAAIAPTATAAVPLPTTAPTSDRITVVPDWICEVVSQSTKRYDNAVKRPFYTRLGIRKQWFLEIPTRKLIVLHCEGGHSTQVGAFSEASSGVCVAPFEDVELSLESWWAEIPLSRDEDE